MKPMPSQQELRQAIRAKVIELAGGLGKSTADLSDDDVLLEKGLLDSASVLELLVWLEGWLDIELDPDGLSLDNFGSIQRMAESVSERQVS